jgi:hypothetical protein
MIYERDLKLLSLTYTQNLRFIKSLPDFGKVGVCQASALSVIGG